MEARVIPGSTCTLPGRRGKHVPYKLQNFLMYHGHRDHDSGRENLVFQCGVGEHLAELVNQRGCEADWHRRRGAHLDRDLGHGHDSCVGRDRDRGPGLEAYSHHVKRKLGNLTMAKLEKMYL